MKNFHNIVNKKSFFNLICAFLLPSLLFIILPLEMYRYNFADINLNVFQLFQYLFLWAVLCTFVLYLPYVLFRRASLVSYSKILVISAFLMWIIATFFYFNYGVLNG